MKCASSPPSSKLSFFLSEKHGVNSDNSLTYLFPIYSHDSIVGYKEAFFEDSSSCLCIVMDYLNDGDLYQKIVKH